MNKIERLEFILERMKDGVNFELVGGKKGKYYFSALKKLCLEINNNMSEENMPINDLLEYELSLTKHIFTEDEKAIMKYLPYKWLVRDNDDELFNYKEEPFKQDYEYWYCEALYKYDYYELEVFKNLFRTIQWENDEPVNIEDYI